MRRVFFALLFLNLAYLGWALWVTPPPSVPANPQLAHLPSLKLLTELPADKRPDPDAVARKPEPVVTTTCMSVGPFPDVTNSAQAAAILKMKGFEPKQRAAEGDTLQGYAVIVSGLKSEQEADKTLVMLEHAGIKDALVMPAGTDGLRRISLGLFTERGRADKRAEAVKSLGLKPDITERKIPGTLYWVDLAPQPGMSSVPMTDLFAEGVSSKVSVTPCPGPQQTAGVASPSAAPAPAPASPATTTTASAPTPGAVPKLP
ncbi:MAG: SPOR domain-containing protein [Proteobacteria bacterium]|nr:SPOR domain-containing protein [Pseudomonadota bacterium]